MFQVHKVTKSFAKHYYVTEQLHEPEWLGIGSERLKLGKFNESDYNDLLDHPLAGNTVAGWELTVSTPKSVSVLGLVGGDESVLTAEQEAMRETVVEAEKLIRTQVRAKTKKETVDSQNGIFAAFSHATSREDDPQKHTHVFMFNATWAKDKWRAVNEIKILKLQKDLTQFYRRQLRDKLIGLGYAIATHSKGFEMAGYTREQLMGFSNRRKQIIHEVGADANGRAKQYAALKTRSPKSFTPLTELKPWWNERAKSLGIEHPTPSLDAENVNHLMAHHFRELTEESGIDPELAKLNFESIEGNEVLERLLQNKTPETGWAAQYWTNTVVKAMGYWRESSICDGGFWCKGGINAQDMRTDSLWGSFKADRPRFDSKKNKPKKYEHPLGKNSRRIFLLHVPDSLAQKIYAKYGINANPDKTFWENIRDSDAPIEITEGAKKTAALLSQGVIAIGVPGVNATYQKDGERRVLHPDLAIFANGRDFIFTFDQDKKLSTREKVTREIVRGAELLNQSGSNVSVRSWQWKKGKGVDDFLVNGNSLDSTQLKSWEAIAENHYRKVNRKIARQVSRTADEEYQNVGIAMVAISRYGLDDGIRVLMGDPSFAEMTQDEQMETVMATLRTLEQRLSFEL